MNKFIVAALAAAVSTSSYAVDATLFGSIEMEGQVSDGTTNVASDDTYVGVNVEETINDLTIYSKVSMTFDQDANNSEITSREVYVGATTGGADVRIGKMKNIAWNVSKATVDSFKSGERAMKLADAERASNTIMGSYTLNNVTVMGSAYTDGDGTDGEKRLDAYEIGASLDLDVATVYLLHTEDRVTEQDTTVLAAKGTLDAFTLAGAYEITDGSTDNDVYSVTGTYALGQNDLRVGWRNGDNVASAVTYELVHNYTDQAYAYASIVDETNSDNIYTVGLGLKF